MKVMVWFVNFDKGKGGGGGVVAASTGKTKDIIGPAVMKR